MAFVKFLNADNVVKCSVIPRGNNVVTLKFPDTVVVNTSGFHVYLDKKMTNDIGGKTYEKFTTIYRNDEQTAEYGGYQLSNDGSVYVSPKESIAITDNISEMTEEEKEIYELENKISAIKSEIHSLKLELESTDYIIIKSCEANLVGEFLTEYNYAELHEHRQILRDKINKLEIELSILISEREVI